MSLKSYKNEWKITQTAAQNIVERTELGNSSFSVMKI